MIDLILFPDPLKNVAVATNLGPN